jgi:hypothetical protein
MDKAYFISEIHKEGAFVASIPQILLGKVTDCINRLTMQGECTTTSTCEALYAEMARIEQKLTNEATKPLRMSRSESKPMVVGPVTERQKLLDLAG